MQPAVLTGIILLVAICSLKQEAGATLTYEMYSRLPITYNNLPNQSKLLIHKNWTRAVSINLSVTHAKRHTLDKQAKLQTEIPRTRKIHKTQQSPIILHTAHPEQQTRIRSH